MKKFKNSLMNDEIKIQDFSNFYFMGKLHERNKKYFT
jgi:hypothetical protein